MTTDATPPMEDRGALLSQAIDAMRALAANVSGDQWDAQSPCTEWKARDVVNHVVGGSSMITSLFAGKTWEEAGGSSESIPEGGDPLAAFDAATGAAKGGGLQAGGYGAGGQLSLAGPCRGRALPR